MFCPSCNGQIYPLAKTLVCPHCFLQLKVHTLKRLTIFLLPDNKLAGIYNSVSGHTVSFMNFVTNPPIEKDIQHRQKAIASRKIQVYLSQITDTLKQLNLERQSLLDSEILIERVLISSFGVQEQSNQCRTQIAQASTLIEKLENAYHELRNDLEKAAAKVPEDTHTFKQQIQQQVQLVRQLESERNSTLRGMD
jgi:hypothetical protein